MTETQWKDQDRILAEEAITVAVEALKIAMKGVGTDFYKDRRNRCRKTITNELKFLKENFPESEILKQNIEEKIDLKLE